MTGTLKIRRTVGTENESPQVGAASDSVKPLVIWAPVDTANVKLDNIYHTTVTTID